MKSVLKYNILLIIVACVVSRLPLLLSQNLYLDGDECILGLMAKHFAEGKGVPLFFYGQSYGFSLIEIVPISLSYFLFGISDIAVKISMLGLWTLGIVFFYKTLLEIGSQKNNWAPLLITLIFVFVPSFAIWSMKARGGYLTAFFLSSVVLYLLFHKKSNHSKFIPLIIGVLLTIIYQSQPLWLVGLMPLLIYTVYTVRKVNYTLSLALGALAGSILFIALKFDLSQFWSPNVLSFSNISWDTIVSVPQIMYYSLMGSYNYSTVVIPVLATQLLALTFTVLIFATLLIGVIFLLQRRKTNKLFYAACVSVFLTLAYLVFIDNAGYRYLLPLSGYALLMFYLFIQTIDKTKMVNAVLSLIIVLGVYSMYSFKNYAFNDKSEKDLLVEALLDKNVEYVYCEKGLLQWEIMFHSQEKIIARYKSSTDRYPKYIRQVDAALAQSNSNIALVTNLNEELRQNSVRATPIGDKYLIIENPSKDLLVRHGFAFGDIDTKN